MDPTLMIVEGTRAVGEKDWDTVMNIAEYDVEMGVNMLYLYGDRIPPEIKREIAISHYSNHGDYYPIIRRCVRESIKCRPDNWRDKLPESVRDLDVFTVYRAGGEALDRAKYSMSWTLSRDVAEWFAQRHGVTNNQPQHIYMGTISADKVIAYLGERSEFEIVQYRNVKNVQELPIQGTSKEYQAMLAQWASDCFTDHSQQALEYFNRWMKADR